MQSSKMVNEIASALVKVQLELKNPAFDSNNPAVNRRAL